MLYGGIKIPLYVYRPSRIKEYIKTKQIGIKYDEPKDKGNIKKFRQDWKINMF